MPNLLNKTEGSIRNKIRILKIKRHFWGPQIGNASLKKHILKTLGFKKNEFFVGKKEKKSEFKNKNCSL